MCIDTVQPIRASYSDHRLRLDLQSDNTTASSVPSLQHRPTHRTTRRIPRRNMPPAAASTTTTTRAPAHSSLPGHPPSPHSAPSRLYRCMVRAPYPRSDRGEETFAAADVPAGCEGRICGCGKADRAGVGGERLVLRYRGTSSGRRNGSGCGRGRRS
jgi:hypothetical protein